MNSNQPLQTIDVINLGDELLLGLTTNTHLSYLGRTFAKYGVTLSSNQVIRDEGPDIVRSIQNVWEDAKLILITGGLGPTSDDITRESVADFLGVNLIFNPEIEQAILQRFSDMGRAMTENNRRQCYQLEGSEVLMNPNGTAPGLKIEKAGKVIYLLPGPPRELMPMIEYQVIPQLLNTGWVSDQQSYIQIRTCGIGESSLENELQPILQKHPKVNVAYCSHTGAVDVRYSGDPIQVKACAEQTRELLGEDFVGFGEVETAQSIVTHFSKHNIKLATAESCTGGMITAALTDIPGSSEVVGGGMVPYTNKVKINLLGVAQKTIEAHDAVSAETAAAMATAVAKQMDCEYGISTTGFAGPTGGNEKDPIGTVYIGFHSPEGVTTKRVSIRGERKLVRQRTVVYALDLIRRKLGIQSELNDQ